jgi:hypothetical protein
LEEVLNVPSWINELLDRLAEFAGGIARFLWPQTFLAFKVRLFTLWVAVLAGKAALNFDLDITRSGDGSEVRFHIGGVDVVSIAATAVTLGILVLANVFIAVRRARFNREILEFARDPSVPESLKREVIERMLDERSQRY